MGKNLLLYLAENAESLLLAAFLALFVAHIYRKMSHRRGFLWQLCFLGILGLFSFENIGVTRNSLYMGPILFTSEKPSPLVRILSGKAKIFVIQNHGRETFLASVSAVSVKPLVEFKVLEGGEYLKESRELFKERTLSLAIPAGKRVSIQTSDDVVLEPHDVHALQFGIRGYYANRSGFPPVKLK
ncbi:MAG: hypothetical protein C4576_19300 [Desulfobacteraceae bacterium]|nr:MAG: hypothetical protein C4576_19300 [Desulfobacteraceae bacterium]